VDKTQYPEVIREAVPRVKVGGLFITDNVLWSGKVARSSAQGDAETRAIQKFNRLIYRSQQLFTTIIPLRDGFAVCERIA
jgi:caffeoyl-CoA O-methyltransferase